MKEHENMIFFLLCVVFEEEDVPIFWNNVSENQNMFLFYGTRLSQCEQFNNREMQKSLHGNEMV